MYFDGYWQVELEVYQENIEMLFTHHNLCIKTCQCSYISREREFLVYISHLHKHLLCIYFCHSYRREKMHNMRSVHCTLTAKIRGNIAPYPNNVVYRYFRPPLYNCTTSLHHPIS